VQTNTRFLTAFILLAASAVYVQAEPAPAFDKLLPERTLFFVRIDNFSSFTTQIEKTRLYKLYQDPSMARFVEQLEKMLAHTAMKDSDEFTRQILDNKLRPVGEILFAAIPKGADESIDSEPSILMLSRWGENLPKVRGALEKDWQREIEKGAGRTVRSFQGVDIITIMTGRQDADARDDSSQAQPDKDDPAPAAGEPDTTLFCFLEDALLVSDDIKTLEFVIAQWKGAANPGLADDQGYRQARLSAGPYYDLEGFVNLKQLLKMIPEGADGSTGKNLSAFGLDNLDCIGFAAGIARKTDSDYTLKVMLKTEGPRKGLLKILEPENAAMKLPAFLSASAGQVTVLHIDIGKASTELFQMLSNFNPMLAASMVAPVVPAGPDGDDGVTIKDDILAHLTGPIYITENTPANSGQTTPGRSLLAIGVKEYEKLQRSVAKIHSALIAPGKPQLQRELLGYTMYLIPIPSFMAEPDEAPGEIEKTQTNQALVVTKTYAFFGDEASVELALRRMQDPKAEMLADVPWVKKAQSMLPGPVGMALLVNNAELFRQLWKSLVAKELPLEMLMFSLNDSDDEGSPQLDFALLPKFSEVEKYFGLGCSYLLTRPDGFLLVAEETAPVQPARP